MPVAGEAPDGPARQPMRVPPRAQAAGLFPGVGHVQRGAGGCAGAWRRVWRRQLLRRDDVRAEAR